MFRLLFFLILLFLSLSSQCQENISWESLADVSWSESYDSTTYATYTKAEFGPLALQHHDREVYITGYVIPLDALGISFALSRNNYASCFFCGQAGPETVMDLYVPPNHIPQTKYNNHPLKFKGTLILKEVNPTGFNYALKDAILIN